MIEDSIINFEKSITTIALNIENKNSSDMLISAQLY